jgi:hypothetical protein
MYRLQLLVLRCLPCVQRASMLTSNAHLPVPDSASYLLAGRAAVAGATACCCCCWPFCIPWCTNSTCAAGTAADPAPGTCQPAGAAAASAAAAASTAATAAAAAASAEPEPADVDTSSQGCMRELRLPQMRLRPRTPCTPACPAAAASAAWASASCSGGWWCIVAVEKLTDFDASGFRPPLPGASSSAEQHINCGQIDARI